MVSCLAVWTTPVNSASFPLPDDGDFIIGQVQTVHSREQDTLLDIARNYGLGINEITAANPHVDPWLPGENTPIVLPTQFILPPPPWEGLVINLPEMRLYYFPVPEAGDGPQRVITHPIGIGRQGRGTPPGEYKVLMKIEDPNWTIPKQVYEEMRQEGYEGSRLVEPGPENPLGKYAIMLNNDGLFMHGTNKPFSIGMRISSGCIRLYPEDVEELVNILPNGTQVRIIDQSYKVGTKGNKLFFEAHRPLGEEYQSAGNLTPLVSHIVHSDPPSENTSIDWDYVMSKASDFTGIPTPVERPGGNQ